MVFFLSNTYHKLIKNKDVVSNGFVVLKQVIKLNRGLKTVFFMFLKTISCNVHILPELGICYFVNHYAIKSASLIFCNICKYL